MNSVILKSKYFGQYYNQLIMNNQPNNQIDLFIK